MPSAKSFLSYSLNFVCNLFRVHISLCQNYFGYVHHNYYGKPEQYPGIPPTISKICRHTFSNSPRYTREFTQVVMPKREHKHWQKCCLQTMPFHSFCLQTLPFHF